MNTVIIQFYGLGDNQLAAEQKALEAFFNEKSNLSVRAIYQGLEVKGAKACELTECLSGMDKTVHVLVPSIITVS